MFLFRPKRIPVLHPVRHFFSYFSYFGGLPSDPRRLPDVPERPSSSATGGGRCTVAEVAPPPMPLKVPPPTAGGDVGVPSVADLRLMEPKKSGVPSWGYSTDFFNGPRVRALLKGPMYELLASTATIFVGCAGTILLMSDTQ